MPDPPSRSMQKRAGPKSKGRRPTPKAMPKKAQEELQADEGIRQPPWAVCLPLLVGRCRIPVRASFANLAVGPLLPMCPTSLNLKVPALTRFAAVENKPFNSAQPFDLHHRNATMCAGVASPGAGQPSLGRFGDVAQKSTSTTRAVSPYQACFQGVRTVRPYTPSWTSTKGDGVIKVEARQADRSAQHR